MKSRKQFLFGQEHAFAVSDRYSPARLRERKSGARPLDGLKVRSIESESPAETRNVKRASGVEQSIDRPHRTRSELVRQWAGSSELGISASQAAGGTGSLRILIEKDLECLDPAAGESQEDAFPHPQSGMLCKDRENPQEAAT